MTTTTAAAAAESDPFPLHAAARLSQNQVIESILSASPRLTLKTDDDGRLPLHWACTTPATDNVQAILDATPKKSLDSTLDAQDSSGWTPLMIASSLPNAAGLPTVQLLLSRDADVKMTSNTGATAVHFATSKSNVDIVKALLAAGATARVKDKRGQLPLHRAAAAGHLPLVKLLLKEGKSPVNASDRDGLTALHHAISEGHGDIAVELLKQGADSAKKDTDERLAINCAPDKGVRDFILRGAEMEGVEVVEG